LKFVERIWRELEKTVAPRAGAWIEISAAISSAVSVLSLPARERGLK